MSKHWTDDYKETLGEAAMNLIEKENLAPKPSCKKCHGRGVEGKNLTFKTFEICSCVKSRGINGNRVFKS